MTNNSKYFIKKFWISISIWAVAILALQFALHFLIFDDFPAARDILSNLFIFSITGLGTSLFVFFRKKHENYLGFIFGGISFIKMLLVIVFLLPVLLDKGQKDLFYVSQFFVIYTIFLIVEIKGLFNFMKKLN